MARTSRWIGLVAAVGLTACVNLRVETRHEDGFDFSTLRSFAFVEPGTPAYAAGDPAEPGGPNPIVEAALKQELEAKGYQPASREQADFLVWFQAGTWSKTRYTHERGIEGHLYVRFLQPGSKQVLWEGHAHETVYANMDSDEEIHKALRRMLDHFPPGA